MTFDEFKSRYQKVPVEHYPNTVADPLVSVCVQAYQHATFVSDCLNGIVMQKTDFPVEVLVGDDASTDGTREICMDFAARFPEKIRLLFHSRENNISIEGRATGRFNFTYNLFSARGKYVAICEGDDYWTDPLKLQKQVNFMEANGDVVLTYHDWSELVNGKISRPKKMFSSTHTLMFRREAFYCSEEFLSVLNGDTVLKFLLSKKGKFSFVEGIDPAVKRRDSNGIWNSLSTIEQLEAKNMTDLQLLNAFKKSGFSKEVKSRYVNSLLNKNEYIKTHEPEGYGFSLLSEIQNANKNDVLFVYLKTKFARVFTAAI